MEHASRARTIPEIPVRPEFRRERQEVAVRQQHEHYSAASAVGMSSNGAKADCAGWQAIIHADGHQHPPAPLATLARPRRCHGHGGKNPNSTSAGLRALLASRSTIPAGSRWPRAWRRPSHEAVARPVRNRCMSVPVALNPAPQLPRRFAYSTPAVVFHERPVRAPLLYLADSNVRRFSDCALHDKTRDMAGVECYPVPPNSQKKR